MEYNSVARLKVETAIYDYKLPYRSPRIEVHYGSSFVVDINDHHLLLLTNAHVVENALSIECYFPFLGEKAVPCTLHSFCYFMDVALVSVSTKDINRKNVKPLHFADSLQCHKSDELIVLGYPLGEKRIQIAKGNVSGFVNLTEEDVNFGPTSYIQVTTPINPGNSGGPGLNNNGDVVGMVTAGIFLTNNIGYLIPVNNILAVLGAMLSKKMLYQPFLGILTNPNPKGLYVRCLLPVSIFNNLKTYDDNNDERALECLRNIYPQKFRDSSHLTKHELITEGDILHTIEIYSVHEKHIFHLDQYGTASIKKVDRLFSINDIVEMIDIGSNVKIDFTRGKSKMTVSRPFVPKKVSEWMVRTIFPTLEPHRFDYLLVGGIIIVENIENFLPENVNLFQRHLIVSYVFSGSILDHYNISRGNIITEVNNQSVRTIDEIKDSLRKKSTKLSIRFKDKKFVEVNMAEVIRGDKNITSTYSV
jgi:S1-C subfamily serine protease